MSLGLNVTVADSVLDALLKNGTYTGPSTVYIQLHTAAPGAAGTTSVASNSTRKLTAWGTSSSGQNTNSADLVWTNVPASETYTYATLWSASSSGTFLGSGTITANAVTTGDTFTISAGSLSVTFNVAA